MASTTDKAPLKCLDEDPVIRRQQFVCLSFLTPGDIDVRDRGVVGAPQLPYEETCRLNEGRGTRKKARGVVGAPGLPYEESRALRR